MVVHTFEYVGHLLSVLGVLSVMIEVLFYTIKILQCWVFASDIVFSHDPHNIIVVS